MTRHWIVGGLSLLMLSLIARETFAQRPRTLGLPGLLQAVRLKVGDDAPDFTLKSPDGGQTVTLSDYRGKRPVALVFGSYTWPPFRHQVGALDTMYEKYRDRIEFFMVYIREAHPTNGWQTAANLRAGVLFEQPTTFEDRAAIASQMCSTLKIHLPPLVDNLDDEVNAAYEAWPDRLYLVGIDGKIAFKSDRGPQGFKPNELEKAIQRTLEAKAF